jgi:hypothetical protein
MSNPKNVIAEIKGLMKQFGFLDEVSNSYKLEDKTIVQSNKLEKGQKISKINDEFKSVPLSSGSYRIDNFNVDVKDGIISTVKEIFLEAKLKDGTVVKVEGEELLEGAKVVVVTEEGELAAPDGVHELESGVKVQTVGGVIVKVEEPEMKVEEEEMEDVEEKVEEDKDKEMVELLKKLMEKVQEKMKEYEDKMSALENSFNAFKKEPASKPIPNGKTEFSKYNESVEDKRVSAILALRNNK